MKRLFATVAVVQVAFITVLAGIRFTGTLVPFNARSFAALIARDSRRAYGGWCWRDICPGTTLDSTIKQQVALWSDLKTRHDEKPETSLTTVHLESVAMPRWTLIMLMHQPSGYVQRIQIQPELNAISIGELMLSIGTPVTQRTNYAYGLWTTVFCFEGRFCAGMIDNEQELTYWSKVDFLDYAARDTELDVRTLQITHRWRGFTSARHPISQ